MGKRRRSTFRRGGAPYGVDGRNKAAKALGRRQSGPPMRPAAEDLPTFDLPLIRDALREAEIQQSLHTRIIGDLIIVAGDELHHLAEHLDTFVPRDVGAVVLGFDVGHEPRSAVEVETVDGEVTGMRALPKPEGCD